MGDIEEVFAKGGAMEALIQARDQGMVKHLGIIGMKLTGRNRILPSYVPPPVEAQKRSWEGSAVVATSPGTLSMREAMYYALTLPISTAIVGVETVAQLEENVRLAREFTPLSDAQMGAIAGKAESVARQAMFYKFFDRT